MYHSLAAGRRLEGFSILRQGLWRLLVGFSVLLYRSRDTNLLFIDLYHHGVGALSAAQLETSYCRNYRSR